MNNAISRLSQSSLRHASTLIFLTVLAAFSLLFLVSRWNGNWLDSAVVKISGLPDPHLNQFDEKVAVVVYFENEDAGLGFAGTLSRVCRR